MERLSKVISNSGVTSRRKADLLIQNGEVKVNGIVIKELGYKVKGNDEIIVSGELIKREDKVYYLLNKPRGIISSASDELSRKTVVDLIDADKRIYPVGRLDYDTSGLILLTNDGELANRLTHPKNNIEKTYVAKIRGFLTREEQDKLRKGIILENKKTKPAKVKVKSYDKRSDTSLVFITITEGRNHQVKNMFKELGHDVLKLKRESISFLTLSNLKSGEYRELNVKEVKKLYNETLK